ncbi:MAG: SIMPL domain-containing protein [Chloroflexota bacterium]
MANLKIRGITGSELRSWVALAATAGLFVGILAGPALAQSPEPGQPGSSDHTISVSGTGKILLSPDVADVSLGVTVQRNTLGAARDDAAAIMQGVIAALHALGIADADIKTTSLYVSPVYDYSGQQRITGYQVSNIVAVHVRDLADLAGVIDDSVAAGATDVQGVSFEVADRTAAEADARAAAVRDARAHADTLAAAAGVTITGVASISETSSTPWPMPYGFARDEAGAATPIQPGTAELTITVSVVYLIG